MFGFEMKKIWKRKLFLWMLAFVILLSVMVNRRARLFPTFVNYPQGDLFYDPFGAVSRAVYGEFYHEYDRMSSDGAMLKKPEIKREHEVLLKYNNLYLASYESLMQTPRLEDSSYPEGLEDYEKRHAAFLHQLDDYIKKYEIPIREVERDHLNWRLFEADYSEKNGVQRITGTGYVSNAMRRILTNSQYLFGIPAIVFLFLLFSGFLSGESEAGTLQLLRTQPISRRKLMNRKFLSMLVSVFVYVILLFAVSLVIFLHERLPMEGGGEIYRIFGSGRQLEYFTGWGLLFRVLTGFLCLSAFFLSFLLWLDSRTGSKAQTMASALFLGVFFGLGTTRLEFLQHSWNPFYLADYLRMFTGKLHASVNMNFVILEPQGMFPYPLFGMLSFVFLKLSSLPSGERSFSLHRTEKKVVSSLWSFERKKLTSRSDFFIALLGVGLLLILMNVEVWIHDLPPADLKMWTQNRKDHLEEDRERLKYFQSEEGERELFRRFYRREPKGRSFTWTEEQQQNYQAFLDQIKGEIEHTEQKLLNETRKKEWREKKDGHSYYGFLFESQKKDFQNKTGISSPRYVSGKESADTFLERMAIYKQASEENVLPIRGTGRHVSLREKYTSPEHRKTDLEERMPKNHSGSWLIYRLFRYRRLDIGFLLFLCFTVFGGFTFDREFGHQLEWMYTEPVAKWRYYLVKLGVSWGIAIALLAAVFVFLFVIGTVWDGVGAWNYPLVCYTAESFLLIPMWQMLVRIFGLVAVQGFLLLNIGLFLSVFLREKFTVIGVTLSMFLLGGMLSARLPEPIRLRSPFEYFSASEIADGSVKILRELPGEHLGRTLTVLFVGGAVFAMLGIFASSKQKSV